VITVLLNPRAGGGGGEDLRSRIADLFREAGTEACIRLLQPGMDPIEAAREAARSSAAVVAAGGDGTVSAVAAAVAGTSVPLGVLPLGTLNHFARDLQLPLALTRAVGAIAAGRRVSVDVGRVNERTFVNNASIGVYPNIVELRDRLRRQGRWKLSAFARATVTVLRTYRGVTIALTADGDNGRWVGRTPFVFVGNNEYTVDGPSLGARRTLAQGRVVAYVAPRMRSRRLPLLFARALVGRALQSGAFEVLAAPHLELTMSAGLRVRVALDGEVITMAPPLQFASDPLALHVLHPDG
jgi:diacylglycerol kinase family enzyme